MPFETRTIPKPLALIFMTKTDIYSIVIKIFGLVFLVKFVSRLIDFISFVGNLGNIWNEPDYPFFSMFFAITISILFYFLIGYIALLRTDVIVNRFFTPDSKVLDLPLVKSDYLEISLAAIGAYIMVYSFPGILTSIADSIFSQKHQESEFWATPRNVDILRVAFEFLSGLFLVLNARNFAKRIVRRGEADDKRDNKNQS